MEELPLIDIRDVSFRYENRVVLEHISLQVRAGEFWALIGPNGSGKSTLLKLILGLLPPQQGDIRLFGEPVKTFRQREKIGYVSQKSNSFNSGFPATVLEVVKSGLTRKKGLFRSFTKADEKKALDALETVRMSEFAHESIGQLSGGQQQRVFIARALIGEPELLIMDEPTVGIDEQNVRQFYSILQHLNEDYGIAIVLVTHEIDLVTNLATHVACLNRRMHFHGVQSDYEQMGDDDVAKWYGHPVRRLHGGESS